MLSVGLVAHEHHGGHVQGQFLDGRVEQETVVVRRPLGDDLAGDRIDLLHVAGQPTAQEGLLHDQPVLAMLLEVQQHQATVEEGADHRYPALLREVLVGIAEDGLRGIGPQRRDDLSYRCLCPADRSTLLVHVEHPVDATAEHLDHVPEHRQTLIAHHRLEAATRWRRGQFRHRPFAVIEVILDIAHPRKGVHGGEAAFSLVDEVIGAADRRHGASLLRSRQARRCALAHLRHRT